MLDLEVVIGDEIPPHAAYIHLSQSRKLRIAVSAQIDDTVLAALHPDVAESVVAFLEQREA